MQKNCCKQHNILYHWGFKGILFQDFTPGPLAPPDSRRPKRNMTALSYSCERYMIFLVGMSQITNLPSFFKLFKGAEGIKPMLKEMQNS